MPVKGKVLVAMSGGIDSTVAALLLHEEGYEVIGVTMKTWDYSSSGGGKKETGCCNLDTINDARQVAVDNGFPHYIIDIRSEFGDFVIDNFVDEYLSGRTPNPCVLCNTHIKWEALLERADAMGCDYIATGHYANLHYEEGRYFVSTGLDETKDQSYVLWGVSQDCLSRTILPLGKFRKSEIRKMAFDRGYEELSKKGESYEICFVPDNDYRGFLKRRVPDLQEKVKGGKFVNEKGDLLGYHEGYPFYTIGQRKGLGIALGSPMFVTSIDPVTNTVVLGGEEELDKSEMIVHKCSFQKFQGIKEPMEALVKVRYKHSGNFATLFPEENGQIKVVFHSKVKGIAPGQSAVFYLGDQVLGGGIILSSQS